MNLGTPRRHAPSGATRRRAVAVAAVLLLAGCATGGRPREHAGAVPTDHPRVALLPFDNLSGREEQERRFTQTFLASLVKTGACDVVDMGRVESMLETLRIRATGSIGSAEMATLGDSLGVRYLLLGSVLEAGRIRTDDGDTPAMGASLRLVDVRTGRIVWADVRVVTGDDRETVFGWGRERSAERLLVRLAEGMLRDFGTAGTAWRERARNGLEDP